MKDDIFLEEMQKKIQYMMDYQVDHEVLTKLLEDCLVINIFIDLDKKYKDFLFKHYPAMQYKYKGNLEEEILFITKDNKESKESILEFYKKVNKMPDKVWKKYPRKKIFDKTLNLKNIDMNLMDPDNIQLTANLLQALDFYFTMMLKKHPAKDEIMVNILLPNTIKVSNTDDYIDRAIDFLRDLKKRTRVTRKNEDKG